MADVLNQDEINALMEAFKSTGGEDEGTNAPEKQVRLYDFARPDKFSKEHLRALNSIHSKHGASFASALASMMRVQTRADLLALDQLTYREYCSSVPDSTLFVEVDLTPLTATAIFEFNPHLVSICVDMLAGGSAPPAAAVSISEVDKAIIKPVVDLALRKYVEAWSWCVGLEYEIMSMTTESSMRQTLLPSEAVLVCGYEVSVGENVSMMSVCLPASAIEPVLPALSAGRTLNATGKGHEKTDPALMKSFEEVVVECRAVLGRTTLSVGEVADLEIGDLIQLPTKEDGLAEFWIENVPAFLGPLGLFGKNLAVKIAAAAEQSDA
ncbi:MAG: FliM/FliN family flagellar motor switch protein [Armatimonadota bacterium]|nr:FliM/FliN family flagellar motor switch protein [bacterium]